ncbi:MAG: hypothetical protein IPK67_01390 [Planctomycetes bacterium]|nr:hypothetical protein [Planctomycetota bacterium]
MNRQADLFGNPATPGPGSRPAGDPAKAPAKAPAGTRARLAFDIELADVIELAPGDDLDRHGPFKIACAAAVDERGLVRHWHGSVTRGQPGGHLDAAGAKEVLLHLRAAQRAGAMVTAWNGLSFDLRWLGHAAGDLGLAREVARELFDPMFQFFVLKGYPVGLAAVADGMGIAEKKSMHGEDAPKEWARGNHQAVLDYVAGDCRLTDAVVARILETGEIRWRTKKGTLSREALRRLLPVRDLLHAPEPDVSWMTTPLPRSKFTAWLDGP